MTTAVSDFRMDWHPERLHQFWNYPTSTYRLLGRKLACNRLDRLSVFAGPSGTGKTESARIAGRYHNCEAPDPKTAMPCGTCSGCKRICGPTDSAKTGAYHEIDGADREDPQVTVQRIYEIYRYTTSYPKSRFWDSGDPKRGWIVFIDEAHRLNRVMREGLLTLVQKWHGAHIILATTHLDELVVRADERLSDDPLLQRAQVYLFDYPTIDQAAVGLVTTAKRMGWTLAPSTARWVAEKHRGVPRNCLGELNTLSLFAKDRTIDDDSIRKAYPNN